MSSDEFGPDVILPAREIRPAGWRPNTAGTRVCPVWWEDHMCDLDAGHPGDEHECWSWSPNYGVWLLCGVRAENQ